jgi:hypothetical protein
MKILIILTSLIIFISSASAQYNPVVGMQNSFKDISKFTSRQSGFEGIQTYSSGNIKGSQFFYPNFSSGSVTTINNETISNTYLFLFDKVRQELFIMSKDDKRDPPEILLGEKPQIKSFTIATDKEHLFVPSRNYIPENTTDFYEELSKNDSGYTLLKFVKTTFVKMDTRDMQKMKSGDNYDEFVDKVSYYVSYKMAKPQQISLKQKSILGAFVGDKKTIVEEYIKAHDQNDINEQFLINLLGEVNK